LLEQVGWLLVGSAAIGTAAANFSVGIRVAAVFGFLVIVVIFYRRFREVFRRPKG
jgi:hypothetical protein